jgi:drug/metabolite transporter (DMT)-like permease
MKGITLALIAMAFFSLYAVFGKILLQDVNPLIILLMSQTLAATIIIGAMDLLKKIREIKETSKHDFLIIYTISVFSSVLGPILFLVGLGLTSVANTVLIAKAEAVILPLLAVLVLKERITLHQVAGTAVMFAGIILIATHGLSVTMSINPGDILILLSACSYSVSNTLFKKHMHHIPPEVIVSLRNLFGASMLFILSLVLLDFSAAFDFIGSVSANFYIALLGLVVITTITGQMLWYKALEITSATRVSIAIMFSPLIGIIYAVTLLGEGLAVSQVIGGIMITTGLVIMEFHIRQVKSPIKRKFHLRLRHLHHA